MNATTYQAAVFGATSAICIETLRALLRQHPARLLLIGRDKGRLETVAADLRCRGAECVTLTADFCDHRTAWRQVLTEHSQAGPWNLFLIAHGTLPDQEGAFANGEALARALDVNFVSPAVIAAACAGILEQQGQGTLAVFGSVAGDRGRGSNFIYGSAKAGIDTFLAGMRHRFAKRKAIKIVTLKPGLTDTPMTVQVPKGPLFSSAETVGTLAWKAIAAAPAVAYLPGWWKIVMALIRRLPAGVLHRTRL